MDVEKPMRKMLQDEDMDTAIYFLDSKVKDKRMAGAIGIGTIGRK